MSAIFKLQPNPVFKADVAIPRAGEEDGVLNFTFKHRPIKELAELGKVRISRSFLPKLTR
ncbi:phage tail assembly chaperone [Klebsiella michiganensis]|uniref:phage tail assembly chaperone n=1 Tax=Klebsiella michiganensis TaxID=1134687 RepID=UPI001E5B1D17|nr:phage tail assembly chaperone [Klebsiella michiganensis]